MKAFKVYPFNVAANGAQPVLAEGSFFRVKSATGDLAVQFDDNAPLGPINSGQGFKVPAGFKRLTIVDSSGAPNVGTIIVAGADFIDQTLYGVVQMVDGEKARTLAGGMFSAGITQNGIAAQYSYTQLWNPAGSGKNLIVSQASLNIIGAAACTAYLYAMNTALAVDVTATMAANKKLGSPMGVAQCRTESRAGGGGFYGALTGAYMHQLSLATSSASEPWPIKGAIVVPPGFGLGATHTVANAFLSTGVEWFEENA